MWRPCSGRDATDIVLTSAAGTGPFASTPDGLKPVLKAARTTARANRHPAPFFRNMEKSVIIEPKSDINGLMVAGLTLNFKRWSLTHSAEKRKGLPKIQASLRSGRESIS